MRLAPRAQEELATDTAVTKPRRSDEDVVQQAKEAGVKLDVKPWDFLSSIAKDAARGWFVKRAEDRGIAWAASVAQQQAQQKKLDQLYEEINDPNLEYPSYYTLPFHGYDTGNLSWRAAHELEAATQSMCLGYYDGKSWEEAQEMFRGAARSSIAAYWAASRQAAGPTALPQPKKLLDVGCSGGFSTHQMSCAFPGVEATGLDMSPYYLSVAKAAYPEFDFVHGKAEAMNFPDGSFDVVTLNFILHELPLASSLKVLRETYRLLAPGGVLAVLDVDPRRLLELPPFRRWAFQVTEPWCKDGEYYALNMVKELKELGFVDVEFEGNDPVNALSLATKPQSDQ